MRGLFYRHRRWQLLNLLFFVVALGCALFFHGVINAIAIYQNDSVIEPFFSLAAEQSLYQAAGLSQYWSAQINGAFALFSQPGLWIDILWLPVSIALIILVAAFGTLLAAPRWQRSLILLLIGIALVWAMPLLYPLDNNVSRLASIPAVGLYFSIAAAWICGTRLRGVRSS